MKAATFLLSFIAAIFLFTGKTIAQTPVDNSVRVKPPIYEGAIIRIEEEKEVEVMGARQLVQTLIVDVTSGDRAGSQITIINGDLPIIGLQKYQVGDRIKFTYSQNDAGEEFYYITDYVRRATLAKLFLLFVSLTLLIGRLRGAASLVGLAFSFFVIVRFILPGILSGRDPVTAAIIGSFVIVPVTFLLSHGWNKKTLAAILGTSVSLVITGILTVVFVEAAHITGFVSEEAGFLQVYMGGELNVRGLLLAGIIIGALGVMDDITVSQAAIVWQLKKTGKDLRLLDIYQRAMQVGHDHIASMVNTLLLVYAGAALPLLLLFIKGGNTFTEVIELEVVAQEIVRTLVGSIGLIVAVPVTTLIACLLLLLDGESVNTS